MSAVLDAASLLSACTHQRLARAALRTHASGFFDILARATGDANVIIVVVFQVTVSTVNDSVTAGAVIEVHAWVTALTRQCHCRTICGIKNCEAVAKVESESTLPTSKSGTDFVKAMITHVETMQRQLPIGIRVIKSDAGSRLEFPLLQ